MNVKTSMYAIVKETASQYPFSHALLFQNQYVDYQTLISKIESFASGLASLGIQKNDTVTMAMPNIFEAIYAFYAVNSLGAIAHLVHPLTPVNQMQRFMEKTGSKTIIIVDTFFDHYAKLLEDASITMILANPTDSLGFVKKIGYRVINRKKLKHIAWNERVLRFRQLYLEGITVAIEKEATETSIYLHSGGTSGEPKTIALSDFAVNSLASKTSYILGEDHFKDRHMLAVLPLFHGFGLCMGTHAMLSFGGVDTLMPKFDAEEAIALIKKNQINYVIGVPSLFESLIGKPEIRGAHLKNLHQAFVGGDYVAMDLKHRFDKLMKEYGSKARLLEGYGLTEVVTVCAVNTLKDHLQTSVGKPLPGLEVAIVSVEDRKVLGPNEPGEIIVHGNTMMNGYLEGNDKGVFFQIGTKTWVLTGDFGFIDEEGYVHFKQRLKRIIKVSGMPVLPAEIENLIMSFPEVAEVAAIGVPDEEKGSMIRLFVVTSSLKKADLSEKIRKTIKSELSIYALPKEIVYLDALPKTIIGKTDTRKLESMSQ